MKSQYPIKKIALFNVWITFFFFLFGFFTSIVNLGFDNLNRVISNSLIGVIILVSNTFINLGMLAFFKKKSNTSSINYKVKFLALSYSLSFMVFLIVTTSYATIQQIPVSLFSIIYKFIISILTNTLILALQNYVILNDEKAKVDIENSQLKAAKTEASNQLLRQQIHPHFLFNALNILKSLYRVDNKSGEEYLIHLSNFLRASVSTNNIKVIPINDELKLCEDYLEMQRIRFGKALTYSISISDEVIKTGFLPSFSIQPLLENAIKHNELTEESPLSIQIRQESNRIVVINNLKLKITNEASTGIGLTNLSERYRILANDDIVISEGNDCFSVSIKILSNEDSNNRG